MILRFDDINDYTFQKTLGEEGSSLEFRHIASYSMWYCVHHQCEELLHEVIVCVGYFTVLNPDNQVTLSLVLAQLGNILIYFGFAQTPPER